VTKIVWEVTITRQVQGGYFWCVPDVDTQMAGEPS
jgi:hypothetical protein